MKRARGNNEPSSAAKRQKFKPEYGKLFPCLVPSKVSECHVRCIVCDIDFKCSSGGKNDCSRHVETLTHKSRAKPSSSGSLKNFFEASNKSPCSVSLAAKEMAKLTLKAELSMCQFLLNHNVPFAAMDTLSDCIRQSFPDSGIASAFKCGRTKSTALIREMGSTDVNRLASVMKSQPFSIATDGSNDAGNGKKHYPLVVRIRGEETVETGLLCLCVCEGQSTGKNIFELVDNELKAHGIPWSNCLAIGTDNAPNMVGSKAGMIAFSRGENANLFKAGCVLHLVHIAARKGAGHLAPIEEALVDVFYYFKKSSLRQSSLKEFQDLYDVDQRKCLKHVGTRWLSIKRCVDRLLHNWEPLKAYFAVEKEAQKSSLGKNKASSLLDFLKSPTNKLFCLFLDYLIRLFDPVLLQLQAEEPLIHVLRPAMEQLLKDVMCKFIKPEVMHGSDVLEIDFQDEKAQKKDEDLGIGVKAMCFIAEAEKHHLREKSLPHFYSGARACMMEICQYLRKALPWEDQLLKAISIVDIKSQTSAKPMDLLYLLRRFPCLVEEGSSLDDYLNMLDMYKILDISDCVCPRLDSTWLRIKGLHPNLGRLCECMVALLTIPHSSAACERVFSVVRKNMTEQRPNLGDTSLEAILVLKSSFFQKRMEAIRQYSPDDLERLKSACKDQLKKP